jgi:16S rRNA (cytidine1402-2'-O)-methyltransferase
MLYIVATPIGNLNDFSERAKEILRSADLILCEDTRVTRKLLDRFEIKSPVQSYHQHSKISKIDSIILMLKEGKNIALVSDAGTPGVSDPGNLLIEEAYKQLRDDLKVCPIPGPSAMASAASIAGFAMDRFIFLGFPPQKNKRQKYFKELIDYDCPVIFYESPYRIIKTLNEIKDLDGAASGVVCRELTKMFESIYRGSITQLVEKVSKDPIKGEYTVVIKSSKAQ